MISIQSKRIVKSKRIVFDSWYEKCDAYQDWEGIATYEYRAKVEYGMAYSPIYGLNPCYSLMKFEIYNFLRHYRYQSDRPFFVIKGETERKRNGENKTDWAGNSNGCNHNLICDLDPKLAELVQFHLWEQDGLPFHYIKNTVALYRYFRKWTNSIHCDEDIQIAWDIICHNTMLKKEEKLPFIETIDQLYLLEEWLEERKPLLQKSFMETMEKWGIEYISDNEIADLQSQVDAK